MHCLIIGQTSQLAKALRAEVNAGIFTADFLGRSALDLSESHAAIIAALTEPLARADVVIIAAAFTAVDKAEEDYDKGLAVNGAAPGFIAAAAAARNIPVVFVSIDYVFAGDGAYPYQADSPLDLINAYGRSKAAGETAVLSANSKGAILCTSWVYDGTGKNFMTAMLRAAESRDTLGVVADQIGRPTYAEDLARACMTTAKALFEKKNGVTGIFHVSNTGEPISWADFARAIFMAAGDTLPRAITGNVILSCDYPTPAKRPTYSVMDTILFESTFSAPLPHWRDGLARALQERKREN